MAIWDFFFKPFCGCGVKNSGWLKQEKDVTEKILGLDIGDKYVGIAVSDALGVTAQGLSLIHI